MRFGSLGTKRGMTSIFQQGKMLPVTVLQFDRVQVTDSRTKKKNGYFAVQVGAGYRKPQRESKLMLGHFSRAKVAPKRAMAEFKVENAKQIPALGTQIFPSHFVPGQLVDVQAISKGKGFAGVMKRWGFKGQKASHGTTKKHRSPGSIGQCQDPGRVIPGKKLPGRMGGQSVTTQNLKVVQVDDDLGVLLVKGAVAGPKGGFVRISDAIKAGVQEILNQPKENVASV